MTCNWYKEWENRIPVKIDGATITESLDDVVVPLIISDSSGVNNADLSTIFGTMGNKTEVIFSDDFSAGGGQWYDANGVSYYSDGYLKHITDGSETYTNDAFAVDRCEAVFRMKQHGRGSGNDQLFVYPFYSLINNSTDRSLQIYMRTYNHLDNYVRVAVTSPGWAYVYYTNYSYNYYNDVGTWFWVKLTRQDNHISFKIWKAGVIEPINWHWEGDISTSHNLTTYAKFGVDSNLTNTFGTGVDEVLILGTTPEAVKIEVATAEGTLCPSEISYYNASIKKLIMWVRIPRIIAGTDTNFFLYYDTLHEPTNNSEMVWANDFLAVYHMGATPANLGSLLLDSSPNEIHGTLAGGLAFKDTFPSFLGNALDFNGGSDYIKVNDIYAKVSELGHDITISVIFKFDPPSGVTGGAGSVLFSFNHSDYHANNMNSLFLRIVPAATYLSFLITDLNDALLGDAVGSVNVCDSDWHHVLATYNNSTRLMQLFVDGVLDGVATASSEWPLNTTGVASIGQEYDYSGSSDYFNGKIDEVEILSTSVSGSYAQTTYSGIKDNLFW